MTEKKIYGGTIKDFGGEKIGTLHKKIKTPNKIDSWANFLLSFLTPLSLSLLLKAMKPGTVY